MEQQEEQKQEVNIIKRALLVEDYVPCQKIMTHYLHELDYQVDLAVDGITAIQHLKNEAYDLIVQDIGLHDISGKEVIRIARHYDFNQGTPMLVWSAYANRNDEEKYLNWGADGALIKAFQPKELKKAIEKCLLKAGYKRKFHFQMKSIKEKLEFFLNGSERLKSIECLNKFKFILYDVLTIIEEYHHWLDFHGSEE